MRGASARGIGRGGGRSLFGKAYSLPLLEEEYKTLKRFKEDIACSECVMQYCI